MIDLFIPYTLLYPAIRFVLNHNDRTVLDLSETADVKERISKALHVEMADLIEGKRDSSSMGASIRMVLGDINIHRSRKDTQFIFVNGRPVENRAINYHMNDIYRALFSAGAYPLFCVYIQMPAAQVDVNVHPTKREVKIKVESLLIAEIRNFCEELLMTHSKARRPKNLFTASQLPQKEKD